MKCPQCGYQELDDSAICSRCGKVLKATGTAGEAVEEERTEEQLRAEQRAKRRRIALPVGAVVVAAAVVVVLTQFVHGAPAQIKGTWTDSTYGGALALLSAGLQMDVKAESPSGQLTGTLGVGGASYPFNIARVTGHHLYIMAKTSYVSYKISGNISKGGNTILVLVTKKFQGSTPTKTQDTLHKTHL